MAVRAGSLSFTTNADGLLQLAAHEFTLHKPPSGMVSLPSRPDTTASVRLEVANKRNSHRTFSPKSERYQYTY